MWPFLHLASGATAGVVLYFAADRFATKQVSLFLMHRRQDLYGALLGVHITMLGFVLATLTIVLGYAQTPRFEILRDSSWFAALFSVFTAALRFFTLAFGATLVALLMDRDDAPVLVLTAAVAASTMTALLSLMHLLLILEKVVRVVTTPLPRPGT